MPQPKKSARNARARGVALSPLLNEIIQAQTEKALAAFRDSIAEQVRRQIVAALALPTAAPVVARKPGRPAKLAKSAVTAKVAGAGRAGGTKVAKAKHPSGATAEAGCKVKGCTRPHRSKGYCAAHYQSARKHGWPTPCPAGFEAPALKRGRPAKSGGARKAEAPAA